MGLYVYNKLDQIKRIRLTDCAQTFFSVQLLNPADVTIIGRST